MKNKKKLSYPEEKVNKELMGAGKENHSPKEVKKGEDVQKEPTVRLTVDVPKSWHKYLKRLLIDEDMTIKDYLFDLLEKDLRRRNMTYDQTEFV